MKFLTLFATAFITAACGTAPVDSETFFETELNAFSAGYANNSNRDFDGVFSDDGLSVTKSYIHIPANNLFGNRYLILDFSVQDISYEKNIEVAFDTQWKTAEYREIPESGPAIGNVYVRYLGSSGETANFSLILHDIIFNPNPIVELKVKQHGRDFYSKIRLRQQSQIYGQNVGYNTLVPKDELSVTAISSAATADKTFLKIDLDIKDIDSRKLLQIECPDCTGADRYKKTLKFVRKNEIDNQSVVVFNGEENGREQLSLYVQFPLTSPQSIKKLKITYIAPGYIGVPTIGSNDGVYGTPYTIDVSVLN